MSQDNLVLMVQRQFKASPERLFEAWTKPELMMQWFHGGEKMTTPMAEADLRVGGAWRLEMRGEQGKSYPCGGSYKVIEPPHKLVFSWRPDSKSDYETTVTLRFKKVSENLTELTLTHEGLRDEKEKASHQGGWEGCLKVLTQWVDQGGK
jgi:uncharacterized protein YndB with AHSA1/START domain